MARNIVPLITNERYHVYNRGVDKREVFIDKVDFLRFYQSLEVFNSIDPSHNYGAAKNKKRENKDRLVQIHAYSLLPNHFHLIIEQLTDDGISNFMKRILGGYTSYFNEKNERTGSLFQGRYKRIHIDTDIYYNYLFSYVNENHFVHNQSRLSDICLSSSNHYQGKMKSKILPELNNLYSFEESKTLALDIADRREIKRCEK